MILYRRVGSSLVREMVGEGGGRAVEGLDCSFATVSQAMRDISV
jgi:hypothetical protein